MRARRLGLIRRIIKRRQYYSIEEAGEKIGLTRSRSYRAAHLGEIPVEQQGRFLLVPRREWDAKVKRLLAPVRHRPAPPRNKPKAAPAADVTSISEAS